MTKLIIRYIFISNKYCLYEVGPSFFYGTEMEYIFIEITSLFIYVPDFPEISVNRCTLRNTEFDLIPLFEQKSNQILKIPFI